MVLSVGLPAVMGEQPQPQPQCMYAKCLSSVLFYLYACTLLEMCIQTPMRVGHSGKKTSRPVRGTMRVCKRPVTFAPLVLVSESLALAVLSRSDQVSDISPLAFFPPLPLLGTSCLSRNG
jgi:hypothetical protein